MLRALAALALLAVLFPLGASSAAVPRSPQQGESGGQPAGTGTDQISVPVPLPEGKKLILKNGTFQIVREYHREGDRVRYYSAERSQWEEIPAAMVDWEATKKAEAEQQAQQNALLSKIKATEEAERRASLDVDTSLEVRPSVFLPDGPGLYVLDGRQVFAMHQDLAESHADKMRAFEKIVTGIPLISAKQHIEIPGKRAKIRIHTLDPEFYFRGEHGREGQFTLVRAEVKGDKRELMTISTNVAGESSYENRHEIGLQTWDAARGVYRYTLSRTLTPGEYALVEMTTGGPALYVWDFGVDAPKKRR
jgi:hypothetical protein